MTMSRFERMLALPEEEYHQLKTLRQTLNPLQDKLQSLSTEYEKQNSILDPYTRVQRQGETLNELVQLKDELRSRLLSMTPKAFQSRAQSMYNFVENKLKFNNRGELLRDNGTAIEGSNITDLIQHAVRDRRRNIVPTGWSHFLDVLRDNNTSRMIMNYETLEELSSPPRHTVKTTFSKPSKLRQPKIMRSVKLEPKEEKLSPRKIRKSMRPKTEPKRFKDYFIPKKYF